MGPPAGPLENGSRREIERALEERVKELTCLYGIAQVAERGSLELEQKVRAIVELLPAAWQFSEQCSARIVLDGREFPATGFVEGRHLQSAEVVAAGRPRGFVEVSYRGDPPPADEGPFLAEERSLVREVARQVGLVLEARETEQRRIQLEEKLRRADRLALVGQLAAGVAHELNEPLVAILGYAELIQQSFGLPDRTARDLAGIVKASLHAREVVRELLLFARQTPVERASVDLNQVVRDALLMLETRLRKGEVKAVFRAAPALPPLLADASQLQQVVLNLCVNALQAMPEGGNLEIRTGTRPGGLTLAVADTGAGMTDEILRHLFTPFFTTKDVGQGTG
ncbi:MAG: PAS domain-containing sensor histidine kinase, partial [Thermoanaerobaculia bacterium]|nr:PAS domain-containing sensor histidine kinase [Thermoanaerobaculia bacterium]